MALIHKVHLLDPLIPLPGERGLVALSNLMLFCFDFHRQGCYFYFYFFVIYLDPTCESTLVNR